MVTNKKRPAENVGEGVTEETPEIKKKKLASNDKKIQKPDGKSKFSKNGKQFSKAGGNPFQKKGDKPEEKKDWQKFKQEKKDLRLKRRQTKNDNYDVFVEAKKIYSKLNIRKTENKKELVEELYTLIKGDTLKKVALAHDTARIIQCMLKYATPKLRSAISEDLVPISVDMSTSKYAHHCVMSMLKYGSPKTKEKLVDSFFGNIVMLASQNISSKILDHVYLTVASNQQKNYMRQEFYGGLYTKIKDSTVTKISDTFKEPHIKAAILGAVKANLEHIANKKLIDSAFIHSVLLEYLKECEPDKIEETIALYSTMIPMLLTTKDGCHASMICFWNSVPKGRRAIVKVIKEHLVKICVHEQGHIFILSVLSSMDDTKAIKKAIFDPIYPEIQILIANQWGRKVIEWFISPGDTASFHPSLISFIEKGEKFGKKDKEIRRKEIFEQVEEPLANTISENPEIFLTDGHAGLFLASILNKLSGSNFSKAAEAISKIICKEDWTVNVVLKKEKKTNDSDGEKNEIVDKTNSILGIEDPGIHIAIKKILKLDEERINRNEETFGSILVKNLSKETIQCWLNCNRGCFVLVNICQHSGDTTKSILKGLIKNKLATLKSQNHTGAKLLIEKMSFK